jgi:hypothetical protein
MICAVTFCLSALVIPKTPRLTPGLMSLKVAVS